MFGVSVQKFARHYLNKSNKYEASTTQELLTGELTSCPVANISSIRIISHLCDRLFAFPFTHTH